jgi:3-oxoacyl-[acyl-carrier protein] reductase
MGKLDGRLALVTGGASGMGEAIVREFVAEGARVIAIDINAARLDSLRDELGEALVTQVCDLASSSEITALKATADTIGVVDTLVNNAGIFDYLESAETMPLATWDRVLKVNATAHFELAQLFLPGMVKLGRGAIIGIASAAGVIGGGGGIAYTASKHAAVGICRQLAAEYGPRGIRSNVILPGVIDTPLRDTVSPEMQAALNAFVANQLPARRVGHAREVARAALFLASDDASFIHGAALPVDGGFTAI